MKKRRKVVVVYNLKGGCGKTTAVVNCAIMAYVLGIPCVVLDADPQKNTTRFLARYAKREFVRGQNIKFGTVLVTGDIGEIEDTEVDCLLLIDAPPDYRFLQNFERNFDIDVLLVPVDGSWAADGSVEVIEKVQSITPETNVILWYNKAYDSKFTRAELKQISEELGMVKLFRHPIPASENFKRSESLSVPVWEVPYASRSLATMNMKIFCEWVVNGCDDDEVYSVEDAVGRSEFASYRTRGGLWRGGK